MLDTQAMIAEAHDGTSGPPQRLNGLMKTLVDRIEALEEDNRQLRAAVHIYREVLRRSQTTQ